MEHWLASLPNDPALVRVGSRAAVTGLEDRIAQVDDLLSEERAEQAQPARLSALQEQRQQLMGALVRVRYAETDKMGVVYYANYLVWFEVSRTDWLRHAGWSYRDMETEGFMLPVMQAHCAYRQSARYDDEIEISARGTLLSPVRMTPARLVESAVGAAPVVSNSYHLARAVP